MHRGNARNTGTASGTTPTTSIRDRWQFDVGANALSAATVVDGTVYVGSADGFLYALDVATGGRRWRFGTGNAVRSTPAVTDGSVYVGSDDGSVYALSTAGNEQWRVSLGLDVRASPTPVGDTVYVGGRNGDVYALDAETGDERWSFTTNDPVYGSLPVVDGVVYVANQAGMVFALDAEDGRRYWVAEVETGVNSPPVVANGTLYLASANDQVTALTARFGEREWSRSIPIREPATVAVTEAFVAVPGFDGTLYVLDPDTGADRYQFDAGIRCLSTVVADGVLCIGTTQQVRAIDPETSAQLWTRTLDSGAQPSLSVAGGVVYAAGRNGSLHAIVGDETPAPDTGGTATPTTTPTATPTTTPTATPESDPTTSEVTTRPPRTATPTPDDPTATPVGASNSPTDLVTGDNPMLLAGVGGAVVGSILLAGYVRRRGSPEDGAVDAARDRDGTEGGTETDDDATPSTEPESNPDELVEKATRALEAGQRATDRNEYGRAATHLEEAVDTFDRALSAVDDETRAAGIRDDLETAKEALLKVDSAHQAVTEVRELLATAEADMENAIAAFVNDQRTVARVRFRQARDRYDRAVTRLEDTDIEQLNVTVTVSTDDAFDEVDSFDAIPGLDEDTVATLRNEGYDAPVGLRDLSVEDVATTAGVDDATAARLAVASWHTVGGERTFPSVDDVADRLESARLGYQSC
jgi:outer membrane protein assembly factor BamB